jgi:Fur family transcriptional regulator, stress-responsive regulator
VTSVEPRGLLRAAGLRITAPRIAALDLLQPGGHLDAEAVARGLRARLGTVSTQAVYDVLHALTGVGLLRKVTVPGSPARYERRVGDNHHHLVCRSCGAVADVDCAVGAAPCLSPSDAAGFVVDEAEVVFWGLCSMCQNHQQEIRGGATA